MLDLSTFTMCLQSCVTATKIGKLFDILQGFLCVPSFTGGIRSLSRYTVQSERALSRLLCGTDFNWILIFALFFRYFLYKSESVYLMSSDETVEGKAGNATFGLDKFYCSILGQPIKSVRLSCFSLLDVTLGKSYFMGFRQVVRTDADKARIAADKEHKKASKGKPSGRQKGTKNKPKGAELEQENASYRAFKAFFVCLIDTLRVIIPDFNLLYLVVDSAYGNQKYLKLAKEKGIFIISRLRKNPALWFNFEGPKGKTKPKKYGDKVAIFALNQKYFKYKYIENDIVYNVYQFQAWNKEMTDFLLNVVCVIADVPNAKTKKAVCFFSNDLNLSAENIIAYYKLRFQIEFNFRDAKEHFGLHKMKNYKQIQMTNMFNLAFLALLFAQVLQQQWAIKLQKPKLGISDIKTIYKAQWTLKEAIKANQNAENPFFSPKFIHNFVPKDIINAA